jgi:spore coat polysaccharide biosynthesis protein SpsF (cytidylyltransferase family)
MSMVSPRFVGIILARMDSGRLPGKALGDLHGVPLIEHSVRRARGVGGLAEVVLATTERAIDDSLCRYAQQMKMPVFRGSTDDVAKRVLDAASDFAADYFIRFNGDSPFLDRNLISRGIQCCLDDRGIEVASNLVERTYPYGIAVEVVSVPAFKAAYPRMEAADLEHVTRYLYKRPAEFKFSSITTSTAYPAGIRLTVDTAEDRRKLAEVCRLLGPRVFEAGCDEVVAAYQAAQDSKAGQNHA